jgi:malonate transporter
MNATLTLAVPFFGLVILGYVAGRFFRLAQEGLGALQGFATHVALPVLFFSYIAETPIQDFAGVAFLITTAFSTYCAFAIAFSVAALINRGNVPEATVQGLLGSWSNSVLLAPGLTIAMFGPAATLPTALVFGFDFIVLVAVTPLMMALGGLDQRKPAEMAQAIVRRIVLHPIVVATVLGLIFAATEFTWPDPVDALFAMLRGAAPPAALFAVGTMLATAQAALVPRELPYLAASKLVVHPMIVYVLLSWVGDFPPTWVYTAVLIAALPSAPEVLAYARSYNVYEGKAAAGVLAVSILSLITLGALIYLIGNRILPPDLFP